MTPTGNRIGNRNEGQGDIIRAEGARCRVRRSGAVMNAVGLPCLGQAFDLVTKVLEVAGADVEAEHFLDHR